MKLGESTVEVTWEDAWACSGYYTLDSIKKTQPFITRSVGVIIRNDDKGVCIAREYATESDDRFRAVQHIPRSLVRKVKVLK